MASGARSALYRATAPSWRPLDTTPAGSTRGERISRFRPPTSATVHFKTIWKQQVPIGPLAPGALEATGTINEHIGLRLIEIGPDFLRGTMPVDGRTRQPYGRLHGGASCVLAETLGSMGAALCTDPKTSFCVGLEINANHLRGVREGIVTGTARPIHIGRTTQVWDIRIEDEEGKLVCVSRLTVAVVPLPPGGKPV